MLALFEEALHLFAAAQQIRPSGNDDAILRWNRCVRLLQNPAYGWEELEQELVRIRRQRRAAEIAMSRECIRDQRMRKSRFSGSK